MNSGDVTAAFVRCLENSRCVSSPYRHWLLQDALPAEVAKEIVSLEWPPAPLGDTYGKRETHNTDRSHINAARIAKYPVCAAVAEAFQGGDVVAALEKTCGVDLTGTSLRIEFCQDREGFWLEPHTDIGAKRFTMLIYLSDAPGCEEWGTDVLDENLELVHRAPAAYNQGVIFIPAHNTWHSFKPRPISGLRRTLMLNYVGPEWRARHELCFPEQAVA
jgi:hypothetical protein